MGLQSHRACTRQDIVIVRLELPGKGLQSMLTKELKQPEIIVISYKLRLRKYGGDYAIALGWYQDAETLRLVDGVDAEAYDYDKLRKMYDYLRQKGELYWIEALENDEFVPIGDVAFWSEDLPIVIGEQRYRGKGIGKKVLNAIIKRASELEYRELRVQNVYMYNTASQKLFESVGFKRSGETEHGCSYVLRLSGL